MNPSYVAGGELAPTRLWLSANGTLVDLSVGFTPTAILGRYGDVIVSKTTGLTGQAGSGVRPTGTPNLIIAWADGELAHPPGRYTLQVQARDGTGLDYRWTLPFDITRGYDVT
jgi:hypothetical protein